MIDNIMTPYARYMIYLLKYYSRSKIIPFSDYYFTSTPEPVWSIDRHIISSIKKDIRYWV